MNNENNENNLNNENILNNYNLSNILYNIIIFKHINMNI